MNKSAGQDLVATINSDPMLRRLREQQAVIETKLAATQREITDALAELQAARTPATGTPSAEDYLATLERPVATVDSLREHIRLKRLDEGQLSETARTLRSMILRRENAAFYEALPAFQQEQVRLGGRVLDAMMALAQLWIEERELRAPLKAISKFEAADCWASHPMTPAMIREKLTHLEQRGYKASGEQLRRLKDLERFEAAVE